MKKAVITGIYGQDGSFLYELLSKRGYQICGVARRELSSNSMKIKKELGDKNTDLSIRDIDIYNYQELSSFIAEIQPDEFYHMAAYHVSSDGVGNGNTVRQQEIYNKNVLATANILEACYYFSKYTKVITAGSCLMYDASDTLRQTESTPFASNSLYGMAKISENMLVQYYRKKGLYACTAILYNHESHRRASQFVTKKIVENMVRIKKGEIGSFNLGSLDSRKDWGYAGDYAEAMRLMLQSGCPKDYIVATGETHSIRDFAAKCADILGINDWEKYILVDTSIINRKITGKLVGDNSAIQSELLWRRSKNFEQVVEEMVNYELSYNVSENI